MDKLTLNGLLNPSSDNTHHQQHHPSPPQQPPNISSSFYSDTTSSRHRAIVSRAKRVAFERERGGGFETLHHHTQGHQFRDRLIRDTKWDGPTSTSLSSTTNSSSYQSIESSSNSSSLFSSTTGGLPPLLTPEFYKNLTSIGHSPKSTTPANRSSSGSIIPPPDIHDEYSMISDKREDFDIESITTTTTTDQPPPYPKLHEMFCNASSVSGTGSTITNLSYQDLQNFPVGTIVEFLTTAGHGIEHTRAYVTAVYLQDNQTQIWCGTCRKYEWIATNQLMEFKTNFCVGDVVEYRDIVNPDKIREGVVHKFEPLGGVTVKNMFSNQWIPRDAVTKVLRYEEPKKPPKPRGLDYKKDSSNSDNSKTKTKTTTANSKTKTTKTTTTSLSHHVLHNPPRTLKNNKKKQHNRSNSVTSKTSDTNSIKSNTTTTSASSLITQEHKDELIAIISRRVHVSTGCMCRLKTVRNAFVRRRQKFFFKGIFEKTVQALEYEGKVQIHGDQIKLLSKSSARPSYPYPAGIQQSNQHGTMMIGNDVYDNDSSGVLSRDTSPRSSRSSRNSSPRNFHRMSVSKANHVHSTKK